MRKFNIVFLLLGIIVIFSSCYTKKHILFFRDLEDQETWSSKITSDVYPTFKPNDRISIKVLTMDKGTTDILNSGVLMNSSQNSGVTTGGGTAIASTTKNQDGYQVDMNGDIFLPYIGKIKVEGLTKEELKEQIKNQISRYIKDPIVYVDWLNFKYTIIGETGVGVFESNDDRINLIEVIAKAGGFRPNAKMDDVMLIREENGERKMVRINFQNSEIFNSPYFYVKQNDIIYVTPTKFADQTADRKVRQVTMIASLVTLPMTMTSTVLLFINRLK